jgi:hypothetical protein
MKKARIEQFMKVQKKIYDQAGMLLSIASMLNELSEVEDRQEEPDGDRSQKLSTDHLRTLIQLLEERLNIISDLEDDLNEVADRREDEPTVRLVDSKSDGKKVELILLLEERLNIISDLKDDLNEVADRREDEPTVRLVDSKSDGKKVDKGSSAAPVDEP